MGDNNKHLVPVFIIYADGVRLDTEHEGAVRRIRVSDCLDGIGRCVLEFGHPAAGLLERGGAVGLESAVDVHLGYKDECGKVFGGEGDHRIRPGMRVTLKYVGERFSGEYVAERVNHEFSAEGFITEVYLRRNMLPGKPKRTSAIDEEREKQHNSASAANASSQEAGAEQEEERSPAITNPHWENADGQTTAKALVGDEVTLCADVQDIGDGASAKIKIVEKDADGNDDDVATLTATVSGGRIECKWKVVYMEDDDDLNSEQEKEEKGYTLPEYAFTVECGGATSGESGQLDVMGWIKTQFKDKKTGKSISNCKYIVYLLDGSTKTGITNAEGVC